MPFNAQVAYIPIIEILRFLKKKRKKRWIFSSPSVVEFYRKTCIKTHNTSMKKLLPSSEILNQLVHQTCNWQYRVTSIYRVIQNDCPGHTHYTADATPCDLFLWGYVKDQVYVPPLPVSIPELKVRIRTSVETITADMLQTVSNELDYRVDVCRITKGAHIEHL